MLFREVAEIMEKIEDTTKRLEMTDLLVELFRRARPEEIEKISYLLQGKVRPDYEGVEFGLAEKLITRAISSCTGLSADEVEKMYREIGDLGEVAEKAIIKKAQSKLVSRELTVLDVYNRLYKAALLSGKGATMQKIGMLSSLLSDATSKEAKYIVRMVSGKLRLGIADYTILDALAVAYASGKEDRALIERAYNISSDLGAVAREVAAGGLEALANFKITVGKPIRPMLAERLSSAVEILGKIGPEVAAEYKLDGERVQIHKSGEKVFLFSRRLENITHHYPDAAELVKSGVKVREAILEAECVAVDLDTGDMMPFQELMHRRRKYGVEEAMEQYPVSLFFFDLLYVDGEDLTTQPYTVRRKRLTEVISMSDRMMVVKQVITGDAAEIERMMEQAISEGCEGLVVKDLNAPYRAGAREWSWIKLKREYKAEVVDTLDLVIVGAFWGRGRRAGKYGAFLLASYDEEEDVFRTFAKCGTGFTDEDLENFPKMLDRYRLAHRHARVDSKLEADIWFEPRVVIEVIVSEITLSPIHTCGLGVIREGSGLAGRFPKFTGKVRDDKAPEQATSVTEIVEMYRRQLKKIEEVT